MLAKDIISQLIAKRGELPSPPTGLQEVLTICCILSFLLPAGVFRLSAGSVIFGFYAYLVFCTEEQSRKGYLMGVSCTILVYRWVDLVVCHRAERDFWRVERREGKVDGGDGVVEGRKQGGEWRAPRGGWEKFKWGFLLWNNQRGVGWNIEPDCIPAPVPLGYPQSNFFLETLRRLILAYVGELTTQAVLRIVYFYCFSNYPSDAQPYEFFRFPLFAQVLIAWTTAFKLYYHILILYNLGALLTIPLSIYTPQDWPPIFGPFLTSGWSVRHIWGRCWHQMMRRPCSEAGRAFKDIFGFRKGGFMSRYSQVWVGFAVSAVAHHVGAKVGIYEDGGYYQGLYFMVQPVGIMVEDGVMGVGRRLGLRSSGKTKLIGALWVLLWFSWSLRFMVAYQPTAWLIDEGVIPFGKLDAAALEENSAAGLLTAKHWKLGWLFGQPVWK